MLNLPQNRSLTKGGKFNFLTLDVMATPDVGVCLAVTISYTGEVVEVNRSLTPPRHNPPDPIELLDNNISLSGLLLFSNSENDIFK